MTMRFFATPQDAEAAFYDALERADLEAMMAIWAEDEEVTCTHPGGSRLAGFAAVREGWRQLFASGVRPSVRLTDAVRRQGILLALTSGHEHHAMPGEPLPRPPLIVSHVWVRGAQGWHLLSRHASSAPPEQAALPAARLH